MERLRSDLPDAVELLNLCAVLGPHPIPRSLLQEGRHAPLDQPVSEVLQDPIRLSRAMRELGRYGLVRNNQEDKTLQVHRLVQYVVRSELDQDHFYTIRHASHWLLAASAPADPELEESAHRFGQLLGHIDPSGVMACRTAEVRRFCVDVVLYLRTRGDLESARSHAEEAITHWSAESADGVDDRYVLVMSRELGVLLRALGEYGAAYELNRDTVERMRRVLGEDNEETLRALNSFGGDLRARGDFQEARASDERSLELHRRVFGRDHPRAYIAAHNLAIDYRLTSDYRAARELDERNYSNRRAVYGRDDQQRVLYSRGSLARDLRELGEYGESRRRPRGHLADMAAARVRRPPCHPAV